MKLCELSYIAGALKPRDGLVLVVSPSRKDKPISYITLYSIRNRTLSFYERTVIDSPKRVRADVLWLINPHLSEDEGSILLIKEVGDCSYEVIKEFPMTENPKIVRELLSKIEEILVGDN